MQILVKRIPHEKLVAAELFIRGGVRNWTAEKAGVERLALETAVAGGTEKLPKAEFSRQPRRARQPARRRRALTTSRWSR